MLMNRVLCLLLGASALLIAPDIRSGGPSLPGVSQPQRDRHVEARLLSEQTHVAPGESWWVALELKHDPTWHTYWINGGDAGVATTINWQLPEGVTAGPIQWEVPQIVKMLQLDVYGYEGICMLLVQLKAHPEARLPETFEIHADVNWMMCSRTCMPGKGVQLNLTMGRADDSQSVPQSPWADLVRQAVLRLPATAPKDMFSAGYDAAQNVFQLRWKAFPGEHEILEVYYFDTTEQITSNQPQVWTQVEEGWQLALPRASYAPQTFDRLKGVLRWKEVGADTSYRWLAIDTPVISRE
jgi:thiol:disulfide interchange protein DsbD